MPRHLLGFIIALVVFVVASELWSWWRARRSQGRVGFREFVRSPALAVKLGRAMAARNEAEDALTRLPSERLVAMLLDDRRFDVAQQALKRQGGRAAPALVAAIGDRRYRRKTDPAIYERMHILLKRKEPLETVLECLGPHALPEHARALEPLLTDESEDIRGPATRAYAAIGTDDVLEGATRAMRDPHVRVVNKATIGVIDAVELGVATPRFREAMFAVVQGGFRLDDSGNTSLATRCLLKLDAGRARPWLLRTAMPRADARVVGDVLRAFRFRKETVDEEVLTASWDRFSVDQEDHAHEVALVQIVIALARHQSESAGRIIEQAMRSSNSRLRIEATDAMAYRMGITAPYEIAGRACEARGWDGLTAPQRHVLAVRNLIDQVLNGGYEQYFVNSYGDRWPDALAGLRAIGAEREHASFAAVVGRFGDAGPSTDRTERHEQLAALTRKSEQPFYNVPDSIFKTSDDLEVVLIQYIVEHRSDFT